WFVNGASHDGACWEATGGAACCGGTDVTGGAEYCGGAEYSGGATGGTDGACWARCCCSRSARSWRRLSVPSGGGATGGTDAVTGGAEGACCGGAEGGLFCVR